MITVYKYKLKTEARSVVAMPRGAELLRFGVQGSTLCIWALVDTEAPETEWVFRITYTGESIDEAERQLYVGTAIIEPSGLVCHCFSVTP